MSKQETDRRNSVYFWLFMLFVVGYFGWEAISGLTGCSGPPANENRREAQARTRIASYLNANRLQMAVHAAQDCQALGWIGQNDKPDTIWRDDSSYFVWIEKNSRGAMQRNNAVPLPESLRQSFKAKIDTLPLDTVTVDGFALASVQAAMDSLPDSGGVVRFPAGTYDLRNPLIAHIDTIGFTWLSRSPFTGEMCVCSLTTHNGLRVQDCIRPMSILNMDSTWEPILDTTYWNEPHLIKEPKQ